VRDYFVRSALLTPAVLSEQYQFVQFNSGDVRSSTDEKVGNSDQFVNFIEKWLSIDSKSCFEGDCTLNVREYCSESNTTTVSN
jgi:hypothetical protein